MIEFSLQKIWGNLGLTTATIVTVILGATMRGDWLLAVIHMAKVFGCLNTTQNINRTVEMSNGILHRNPPFPSYFTNVQWFVLLAVSVSFISYYSLGGWLQWHFYIKRKEQAEEWKCQPDRWLTKENERHEIKLGSFNMALGGTLSGIIACYVYNGGYCTLYYDVAEYGWIYLFMTTVLHFLITDGMAFALHKLFHIPFLYKNVHKIHHRYNTPTAFSAVAMHPGEFLMYQIVMASPMFLVPIHAVTFVGVILYAYYYGMIDHSGVKMDAIWPWQPDSMFHDNHHRYFHTNFGFNTRLFDWYFDTLRLDSRIYGEDIFGGKGKSKAK